MTYNFFQLISQFSISIPMIQRDYAQGRKTAGDIRVNFLTSLKEVLVRHTEDSETVTAHLDFVYGFTKNHQFVPLDGQQRLTTLFLLHWYIAAKESLISAGNHDESSTELKKVFGKFSYETRLSSERFCETLAQNPIKVQAEDSLEDAITDSAWFVASWLSDPTVQSMLTMLEAIHQHFYTAPPLWDRLTAEGTITFEFIDIKSEQFRLTDELYIKMNSRGKALSDFETFKAQFTDLLSGEDFAGQTITYGTTQITYRQYFEIKMDGAWMNLFWDRRNIVGIDDGIINFLTFMSEMLYYTDHSSESKFQFKDALKTVFTKRKNAKFLFNVLDILSECEDVDQYFDRLFYCEGEIQVGRLKLFEITNKNLFLRSIRDNRFEVRNRILFYALFYHQINLPASPSGELIDFLRIIRNLTLRIRQVNGGKRIEYISNLRLPDFATYQIFIHSIVEKIKESPNETIYSLFAREKWDGFGETYLIPEQAKAKDIQKSDGCKIAIQKLEDHTLLQGITDLFDTGSNRISEITDAFYKLWGKEFNASQLIRGLLTHGDYTIATHSWSNLGTIWYFGTDGYWNRLLTAIGEKKEKQEEMRAIYTGFLLDFADRAGTSKEKLYQIINGFKQEQRDFLHYFVKYPSMTSNFNDKTLNLFTWYENNDYDINNVGSSSVQPLSAYHINPYVVTLSDSIGKPGKTQIFYGRFTDDLSCLDINSKVQLYSVKEGWSIVTVKRYKPTEELISKYKLTDYQGGFLLKDGSKKDRIEMATQFCNEVIEG